MKISIDGGGLCARPESRFGNYIFTLNLLRALSSYDNSNQYVIYSFCQKPGELKFNNNFIYKSLLPKKFWLSLRVSLEEQLNKSNYFLALNQAIPKTSAKTITFSHGLSFYYHKKYYPDSYSTLIKQLRSIKEKSTKIIVSSSKVKREMEEVLNINDKIEVIPYGVPYDFLTHKKFKKEKYFLYVGMDHPVKNLDFLREVFAEFKKDERFKNYKIILIKNSTISRNKLKIVYQKSTAYLTASFYESFNFPVLEALSQNCPVIGLDSAIIPELNSYVNIARNQYEFIVLMKKAALGKSKPIDLKKLRQQFSWQKYVKKLLKLYSR